MSNFFSPNGPNRIPSDQNLRCSLPPRHPFSAGTAMEQNLRPSQQDRLFVSPFPLVTEVVAAEFLRQVIKTIDSLTKNLDDGSTFTGAIITKQGNVVTAHLGDSPASIIVLDQAYNLKFIQLLTPPHLPGGVDGCQVARDGTKYIDTTHYRYLLNENGSRGAGIAVCRALGDRTYAGAVSHEPEVLHHDLQVDSFEGQRVFLLVTSDGADRVGGPSHTQHAFYLSRALQAGKSLSEIASGIAVNSRGSNDNVAVVLVEIKKDVGGLVAVLDGHGKTADVAQAGVQIIESQVAKFVQAQL